MADIYTMNGEEITMGLQGSAVCDEAIQTAKAIARDLAGSGDARANVPAPDWGLAQ